MFLSFSAPIRCSYDGDKCFGRGASSTKIRLIFECLILGDFNERQVAIKN